MPHTRLTLPRIEALANEVLVASGANAANASPVARATMEAERDDIASHGLVFLPTYAEHIRCGKVDGRARPSLTAPRPAVVRVDAARGFAQPAILLGEPVLVDFARRQGIACLAIHNSYNAGVLGQHVERLAAHGLVALGCTNSPAAIAPIGGARAVIGTNPIALATPGTDGPSILIDQSASVIARSEIARYAAAGRRIPDGWATDSDGHPTNDPDAAMRGTMLPAGGHKGFGIGLIVEIFAAALAGAQLGIDASPFRGPAGGPPRTGQFFIAIDPDATSGGGFQSSIERLCDAIRDRGGRLPGSRRLDARKNRLTELVEVDDDLLRELRQLAGEA